MRAFILGGSMAVFAALVATLTAYVLWKVVLANQLRKRALQRLRDEFKSVYVRTNDFGRWIIVCADAEHFAWSGSKWVFIGGDTQVSNFETAGEALNAAVDCGLEPITGQEYIEKRRRER